VKNLPLATNQAKQQHEKDNARCGPYIVGFITTGIKAQVGIRESSASFNATAQLKVTSINRVLLPPRNTFAQRISNASLTANVLGIDKCAETIVYVNDPCD
jgi:hypothetical protein